MGDAQAEQFDDTLLADFADTFYGYGTYNAPYWFIGMEEGGGNTFEEINARLEAWRRRGRREAEDLRSFHEAFGMVNFFQGAAVLQSTWNKLIRVVLSATGRPVTTELVREYQQEQLGSAGGETCLLELLPLPSPTIGAALFAKLLQLLNFPTQEQYKQHYMPLRAAHIAQRIEEYRPCVVMFYGVAKEFRQCWDSIAGAPPWVVDANGVAWAQKDGTLFVITKHPVARGLRSDDFEAVGRMITEKLTPTKTDTIFALFERGLRHGAL